MPFETRPNDPGRALAWTGKTWMGDCDGDMTLEFDGQTWLIKEEVVSAHFRWLNTDFTNRAQVRLAHDASCGWPVSNGLQGDHIVVPPHISKRTHPAIFGLILEFLHTNRELIATSAQLVSLSAATDVYPPQNSVEILGKTRHRSSPTCRCTLLRRTWASTR